MFEKIKNAFSLISFFLLIFLITKYYFSEKNVIFINKSRTSYSLTLSEEKNSLPVLINDTNNIIVFKDDLEEFQKKRKERIWEKLISDKNE